MRRFSQIFGVLVAFLGLMAGLQLVFVAASMLAESQFSPALSRAILPLAVALACLWGGIWLVRRGAAPGYEATTAIVFRFFGAALILLAVLAGGCAAAFSPDALKGDLYVLPVWIAALIFTALSGALGFALLRMAGRLRRQETERDGTGT